MPLRTRFKSSVLLATLLTSILLFPFFRGDVWGSRFLSMMTFGVMLGGLWELHNDRRWFLPALLLAIPTGIVSFLQIGFNGSPLLLPIFQVPLFALVTVNLVIYTLKPGRINLDKLAAAISGYLMLAFTWAAIYRIVDLLSPGSFVTANVRVLSSFDYFYFSVVTITTLGYGDISPASAQARSFVMLEAIIGTLYNVILISRLVSTLGQDRRSMNPPSSSSSASQGEAR